MLLLTNANAKFKSINNKCMKQTNHNGKVKAEIKRSNVNLVPKKKTDISPNPKVKPRNPRRKARPRVNPRGRQKERSRKTVMIAQLRVRMRPMILTPRGSELGLYSIVENL